MQKALVSLLSWLRLIRQPELLSTRAEEMPPRELLEAGQLVIVGPTEAPKWITFQCPSGCGVPLLLSLSPNRRPRWSVTTDWLGRPSVKPSVHRPDGCKCHFWIQRGNVIWCEDSGK